MKMRKAKMVFWSHVRKKLILETTRVSLNGQNRVIFSNHVYEKQFLDMTSLPQKCHIVGIARLASYSQGYEQPISLVNQI